MANQNALVVVKPEQLTPDNIPQLMAQNFLVCSPTDQIMQINPYFSVRISHVQVNTDANGGDIWKSPDGKWSPTKTPLLKIAAAAGIKWDRHETRRVDPYNNPNFCEYKSVGYLTLPSGEVVTCVGTASEDCEIIEEEALTKWLEKFGKGEKVKEWRNGEAVWVPLTEEMARAKARSEFLQYKKFMHERCQTRSMLRAIRSVFALPTTFTIEQLQKGFIVPQVAFAPDPNDPSNRELIQASMAGRFAQMYAPQEGEQPKAIPAQTVDSGTGEVSGCFIPENDSASAEPAAAEPIPVAAVAVEPEVVTQHAESSMKDPINPKATEGIIRHIIRVFGMGPANMTRAMGYISGFCGRTISSASEIAREEYDPVSDWLEEMKDGHHFKVGA